MASDWIGLSDEDDARIVARYREDEDRIYALAARGDVNGLRELARALNAGTREADRCNVRWLAAIREIRRLGDELESRTPLTGEGLD